MSTPLTFYYEYSSPFAYIASELIEALAAKHGRQIEWKPFLLGAVFKSEGTQPLMSYPKKGVYSRHDVERTARYHDIPFTWPPSFPFLSVAAARATLWAAQQDSAAGPRLTHALFRATFKEGRDIAHSDMVAEIAGEAGFDADAVAAALKDPAVKELLKSETDAALDRGVFGAPMIFVDEEPFWGVEKLQMLDRWLERGGW